MGIKVEKLDYISFAKFYAIMAALLGLVYGIGILIFSPVVGAIVIVVGVIGSLVFGFIGGANLCASLQPYFQEDSNL